MAKLGDREPCLAGIQQPPANHQMTFERAEFSEEVGLGIRLTGGRCLSYTRHATAADRQVQGGDRSRLAAPCRGGK